MEMWYHVQLDRMVNELIVPLENQISSEEQEEKQAVVVKKERQEIVGQKICTRTEDTASTRCQGCSHPLCSSSRRGIMGSISSCYIRRRNKEYYIAWFSSS